MHDREALLAVGRVDETPGWERRQAELMRAALRAQPPMHHRERAFRVGTAHPRRQREVGAETMILRRVVDVVHDSQEALAGTKLERRADRSDNGVVGARRTRALVSDRRARPREQAVDLHLRPNRPALDCRHANRIGPVDDAVVVGRRVVVRVAAVAAVDEATETGATHSVSRLDRERAVRRVDLDTEMLVRQRARIGGDTAVG